MDSSYLTYKSPINAKKEVHLRPAEILQKTYNLIYAVVKRQTISSVVRISQEEIIEVFNFRLRLFKKVIAINKKHKVQNSMLQDYVEGLILADTTLRQKVEIELKYGQRNKLSYYDLKDFCSGECGLPFYMPRHLTQVDRKSLINTNRTIFKEPCPNFKRRSAYILIGREHY